MWNRIYIEIPADRDAVVSILAKNGYIVRQGKAKRTSNSKYRYFVEFKQPEESDDATGYCSGN